MCMHVPPVKIFFLFKLTFEIQSGSKGIVGDISMALHDRPGHIDSLYPTISGRNLVKFPSQVRRNLPSTEKSRKVRIQFETNYVEKLSHGSLPCEKEDVNDYCLEQVVERDARCYLPWGLGLAKGTYTPYNKKILLFFKIHLYILFMNTTM